MKRLFLMLTLFALIFSFGFQVFASEGGEIAEKKSEIVMSGDKFNARSVVLMEAKTGEVLLSNNEKSSYSPASVTKIMTLLLVAESISEGRISPNETVTISSYASSMGGSQVFLREGEEFLLEELIKCTVIASANDAAVALAEKVAGSEDEFVEKMNKRAIELGLEGTNFENVTGLDDDTVNHVTSALDIAIMSRELIKHDVIMKYASLWQDSIRDGEFILTNTNRLVRYYNGCTGLKTGSTDKAGSCISVTAERNGMTLIAVVMGAESSNERNEIAKEMLDFGFASFALFDYIGEDLGDVPLIFGKKDSVSIYSEDFSCIVGKGDLPLIDSVTDIREDISAPIASGTLVGKIEYFLSGEKIGESKIYASEDIRKISFTELYFRILCGVLNK